MEVPNTCTGLDISLFCPLCSDVEENPERVMFDFSRLEVEINELAYITEEHVTPVNIVGIMLK